MNVLVVCAHPDDETLGMGGTIRKHADRGDSVTVACMCVTRASENWHEAAAILGASTLEGPEYPDQRLDQVPLVNIISYVEALGVDAGPLDIVYTHNPTDLNCDHRIVCEAVLVAFRPHRFKGTILAFETISSTEWGIEPFQASWYERLDEKHLRCKQEALACYESERRSVPHPRNASGIAITTEKRGRECGVYLAEAFRLLRKGPG